MARETRDERLVRATLPQLTECLMELKNLVVTDARESNVEIWCQTMLKSVLGFSIGSGYVIRNQEVKSKMRFDLVIAKSEKPDQILCVVEVKKLGANLDRSDFRSGKTQLNEYLKQLGGVRWGVLTNGFEWRLYDFKNDFLTVTDLDLRNDEMQLDTSAKNIQDCAWDLLDFSSYYLEKGYWNEMAAESQALSPNSLAKAILSIDMLKKISKELKSEHDYKISVDVLADKMADLLVLGLNEINGSWNEIQKAELDKYIRSQKKKAKKSKKIEKLERVVEGVVVAELTTDNSNADAIPEKKVV